MSQPTSQPTPDTDTPTEELIARWFDARREEAAARPPTNAPPATWPRPRPTAARPSRSSTTAWPPPPASRPGPGPTARSSCGPRRGPCLLRLAEPADRADPE